MQIHIHERLKPFTHTVGTIVPLPFSSYALKIYPATIYIYDLTQAKEKEVAKLSLPIVGPVYGFTAQLDLEKALIRVWGNGSKGFFRYTLYAKNVSQISLDVEKGFAEYLPQLEGADFLSVVLEKNKFLKPLQIDRLSLGCHKAQDFDLVKRRLSLDEILPIWLKLSQLVQASRKELKFSEGSFSLLKKCEDSTKQDIYQNLENLFKVAFKGILVPRLDDEDHLGFTLPKVAEDTPALDLLAYCAKVIRELFVKTESNTIYLFPKLPNQFHSGRFLHVKCDSLGLLDVEWTKSKIRRMYFYSHVNEVIHIAFPKEIKSYRLNNVKRAVDGQLEVSAGKVYCFDRFEK